MSRKLIKRHCKTEVDPKIFNGLSTESEISKRFIQIQHKDKEKYIKRNTLLQSTQISQELDHQATMLNKLILQNDQKEELSYKYTQVCQEFGIDPNQLKKLQSIEAKQDYAIECATKTIKNALDSIMQKYYEKNENQHETELNKSTTNINLYGWLKVKSQYKKLRKILQYALVELVQDQSNSDKIAQFFNFTNKILGKHHQVDSKDFSTYHTYRTIQPDQETLKLTVPEFKFTHPDLFFEWNQAIEFGFLKGNRNFHDTGYDLLKKQSIHGVNSQKREKLLEKCQEGNYITQEELKYLASTSYLINKCLDKEFIQRAINYLDKECLNQIELNIAEQTLQTYNYLMNNQKEKRQEFFEKKNVKSRKLIKKQSQILQKQQQHISNAGQIKLIKKKLVNMLKDVQKKKEMKQMAERKKRKILKIQRKSGNPLANIYVQKFKEIMIGIVINLREAKMTDKERQVEFLERNQAQPPPRIVYTIGQDQYDSQKAKRMFHPPSKIMTNLTEDKLNVETPEILVKEQKKFKLGIRNYTVSQESFSQYYSGGPRSQRQFVSSELQVLNEVPEHPPIHKWITADAETVAANKIKQAIKRYMQKKALNKLIVKKEIKKNRDIEIKIQKCLKAKRFFQELHKELDKKQNEKLKDLSIHRPPTLQIEKTSNNISETESPYIQRVKKLRLTVLQLNKVKNQELDTVRRAEEEIKEITRKKKLMKFSKQKELSEAKLKNRKLIVAAKMRNLQIALTAGFHYTQMDTKLYDKYGNTPLYYAAKNADEQFCRFLLNLGADVNQQCLNGNTPLHMAFHSGNPQIIVDFINNKGSLNALNNENFTPLAFGSEQLLKNLNLFHMIASQARRRPSLDNHNIFHQKMKPQEIKVDDCLIYDKYKNKQIM